MTTYDLNKQGYKNLPDMSCADAELALTDFIAKTHNNYYIMLNHETHYYTVYTLSKEKQSQLGLVRFSAIAKEVIDIAKNLGSIKAIEQESKDMCGIWIDCGDECRMYGFLPYDWGIIEV